jgi:undecaprenyl-diphosphatase
MHSLAELDTSLFKFINGAMANAAFDAVLPILRNKLTWLPLYLILGIWLYMKQGKQSFYFMLGFAACAILSNLISADILKHALHRIRPCASADLEMQVRMLIPCSNGFSMPSAHASNHMAMGVFSAWMFHHFKMPLLSICWIIWALLIGFAQIYVGVHYPGDVLVGFFIGAIIGTGIWLLLKKMLISRLNHSNKNA